jgi:hypothetical protein
MAYEMKDNSGSTFPNKKKEKETHPDETGSALIGGVNYWVSTWVKTDKNGNPWRSFSFKVKEDKPTHGDSAYKAATGQTQGEKPKAKPPIDDDLDQIPF